MGINLTAGISSTGYGQCGLNLLLALEKRGEQPTLWPIGPVEADPAHHDTIRAAISRQGSYNDITYSVRLWHPFDLAQHVGHGPKVGFPIFELDRFSPVELHHLRRQNRLIVPSKWARKVCQNHGLDARVAPLGVDHSIFKPAPLPDDGLTHFLCVGKWELRKGMDAAIRAFSLAFKPGDQVRLTMHCHNPCIPGEQGRRYNAGWEEFALSSPMSSHITLSPGRLATHREVAHLMSRAHCGVFLSRAEGWNLEAAEMLAMGRHAIMTGETAHAEYANEENALLVPAPDMEPAEDGVWFRSDDPKWGGNPGRWHAVGDKEVELAASHMRSVHESRISGYLGLNEKGVEGMKAFTWERTARAVLAACE